MRNDYFELKFKKSSLVFIVILTIGLGFYYFKAQNNVINRYVEEKSLKLQLFPNVNGVKIESKLQNNFFSKKTFEYLEITIPSFASINDDSGKNAKLASQVIDRDKLDNGIKNWLDSIYDKGEAEKLTDHIVIYYRSDKIVDDIFGK